MGTWPLLLLTLWLPAVAQPPANFSGAWTFDQAKSLEQPGPDGRVVLAAMLGDEFVAKQDAVALTLTIKAGGETITAVYKLDGTESRNMSPGGITVTSRAMWDGPRLIIASSSQGAEKDRPVTIETRRVIWLDASGYLIVERTGTPASVVTSSRSVYRKSAR